MKITQSGSKSNPAGTGCLRTTLDRLRPGERFRLPVSGRRGRLLRLTPTAAHVRIDEARERRFTTASGEEVRIRTRTVPTSWSRRTIVDVVERTSLDIEAERLQDVADAGVMV